MIELRLACEELLGPVMDMEREVFEDPWPEWAFRRILSSSGRLFLIGLNRGKPAGYIVAETDTRGLHITNLAVAPQFRRGGIGRSLMDATESWGRRLGQTISRLEVRNTNTAAVTFYEDLGYQVRDRVMGYYGGRCDALVMIRRMSPGANERSRAALSASLARRLSAMPRVGVVLGSGLSWLAESFGSAAEIDNSGLPGMAGGTLEGHPGKLVQSSDGSIVFLLGRRHGYQGYDGDQISLLPGSLADLGVRDWLLTTSSGAVDPGLAVGDAVVFTDHMNFSGTVPSRVPGRLSSCYSPHLRGKALELAASMGAPVDEGVFACASGPQYETSAEVELLRRMGAATVSMSTVPEALALASQGCRVLALSLVTNATGSEAEVTHKEVLEAQETISARQGDFLRRLLEAMAGGAE